MSKQEGLGKGLSSLIPSLTQPEETRLNEIAVEEIVPNPNQPRKKFDRQAFKELVASIKEFGLIQPVVVRPRKKGYELIAGERRWKAAKEAGLVMIPAVVKSPTDIEAIELALVENLQREDLNAIEEAEAYDQLIREFEVTQAEIAQRLGKNRTTIANTLRLLQLPGHIKQLIVEGDLSSGHARTLLPLEGRRQARIAKQVIKETLSVRQTEEIVQRAKAPKLRKASNKKRYKPETFGIVAKDLSKALSAEVRVVGASTDGKIEIAFNSLDELEKIYRKIKKATGAAKKSE